MEVFYIKRPILVAMIGYIIGIIWGLYFNFSIVLLYVPVIAIYFIIKNYLIKKEISNQKEDLETNIDLNQKEDLETNIGLNQKVNSYKKKKFKLLSVKRYLRYLKIYLKSSTICLVIIISIISNTIIIFQNKKYQNLYKEENLSLTAVVVGNKEEKEYSNKYKVKVVDNNKYKNTKLYITIKKKQNIELEYGDKIQISGAYTKPEVQRNYGGFDYSNYLKTLKIYGIIKVDSIKVLSKKNLNFINIISNKISLKIKENIDKLFEKEKASILKGLILGDTSNIEEGVQENFRISNMSHVLAVSGMHISYIIIALNLLLKNVAGKRKAKICICIMLVIYMFITGFSPSIVRAGIMGLLMIFADLIHRKNDTWSSISLSLLIMLIYNPYVIQNIGLQFSYLGTIGIILFNKNVMIFLRKVRIKNKKIKYRINRKVILAVKKIKEILSIIISAQLAIMPVMLFHFNMIGLYFFITNVLLSLIIGPTIILGFMCVISSFISFYVSKVFVVISSFLIQVLIQISNISNLPFSKIYVATPKMWMLIVYYVFILIFNFLYKIYNSKKLNLSQIRVKNLVSLFKYKFNQSKYTFSQNRNKSNSKTKYNCKLIIIFVTIIVLVNLVPHKLNINFVDVGQGDSTFIITPQNTTILIDGGGSLSKEFDVGKSTLLPYILDKGYTKIDYIIISHADQDHIGGVLTVMQEIEVENVIVGKQFEDSKNYQKLLKIAKEKRIKVVTVEAGSKINIEKDLYFDVLWPNSKNVITDNSLNNNSLICKLVYKDFSMLFTGDIEEVAEKAVLKKYGNSNILKSTILKVAHHGSKTSTTREFLEKVSPNIAVIGVGKNNIFGHPSEENIKKLEGAKVSVVRTDENGEVSIFVTNEARIKVERKINYK